MNWDDQQKKFLAQQEQIEASIEMTARLVATFYYELISNNCNIDEEIAAELACEFLSNIMRMGQQK